MTPAGFRLQTRDRGDVLLLSGDWTATALGRAGSRLAKSLNNRRVADVQLDELGRIDTAGALALLDAGLSPEQFQARPDTGRIMTLVQERRPEPVRVAVRNDAVQRFLVKVGSGVAHFAHEFYLSLAFFGELLSVAVKTLLNPSRIRWAAWFSLIDRAGLDAAPIIAITSFFIGSVVAFLGADLLQQFGASVFAVELIGIAVLREFAVVITAVLLAGRSASAFAAEIGSMKMNQEIDAMRVMGVDPYEALVLPRVAALVLMTPLLTFVAVLAGLFGGLLVTWAKLDLGPAFFFQRIQENVGALHFWVGLSKAPVFAAVVAAIGCRQGLAVEGDVESLGQRVTAAVVQAIFAILMIDAVFALLYIEVNL
jgi:phospholipid/cholesterol/gamma-HCH transport system permease protein